MGQQAIRAVDQGGDLAGAEIFAQDPGKTGFRCQMLSELAQIGTQVRGNLFPGEIPDHRTEFVLRVETDSMVDQPQLSLRIDQNVTAFSISIVDERVKKDHRAEALQILPAEIEVMVIRVVVDEKLERTRSVGPLLPIDCRGHQIPSQGLAHEKSGHLPTGERSVRKIPERPFTPGGFVNRWARYLALVYVHQ
jgi:hypothetical protein